MLPFCCHGGHQSGEKPYFTGFSAGMKSFPLYRRRGFGGDVVDHAVDVRHLVHDADGNAVQHVVRDTRPVGGHKIGGGDGAQRI